jgi:hypothetical protein
MFSVPLQCSLRLVWPRSSVCVVGVSVGVLARAKWFGISLAPSIACYAAVSSYVGYGNVD